MIHHQNPNQPQKLWRLWPWLKADGRTPKLTCLPFSYHYHRSKGTTSLQLETRSHRTRDPSFTRKLEEAQVVPFPFHLLLHPHLHVATERNDVAYSLFLQTTNNGTPATWSLVLSSSKPLTGRTGHQLRDASATGTTTLETSLQPGIQEYSTGQGLIVR